MLLGIRGMGQARPRIMITSCFEELVQVSFALLSGDDRRYARFVDLLRTRGSCSKLLGFSQPLLRFFSLPTNASAENIRHMIVPVDLIAHSVVAHPLANST